MALCESTVQSDRKHGRRKGVDGTCNKGPGLEAAATLHLLE